MLYINNNGFYESLHSGFDDDGNACASEYINDKGNNEYIVITRRGKMIVLSILVMALVLLLYGSIADTFQFKLEGLVSVALNWDSQSTTKYSLISLCSGLLEIGKAWNSPYDNLGIIFLQLVFYLIAFVVPVSRIIVNIALWTLPLSLRVMHNLQTLNHFLRSWNCIDVCILRLINLVYLKYLYLFSNVNTVALLLELCKLE